MKATNVKIVFGFLVLCLVAAGVNLLLPDTKSTQFIGEVSNVDGNIVTVKGFYRIDGKPELEKINEKIDVQIKITNSTEFKKTIMQYPTPEELEASGGMFEPGKLRQEVVQGSLDDLRSTRGQGVYVHSASNVYERSGFTASVVEYNVMNFPE